MAGKPTSAHRDSNDYVLRSVEALREHYKPPVESVVLKTIDVLDDYCRLTIAASPFIVLATGSAKGLDCSPKGDQPGFVHVLDEKTLLLPDRPGNNRIDGLTNIVQDPRVGIIFFLPGMNEALRVNGVASISIDPDLLARFEDARGRKPRSVLAISVREVFIHCGRAMEFAHLWDTQRWPRAEALPDLTAMFEAHVEYSRDKQDHQEGQQ